MRGLRLATVLNFDDVRGTGEALLAGSGEKIKLFAAGMLEPRFETDDTILVDVKRDNRHGLYALSARKSQFADFIEADSPPERKLRYENH